MKAKLWENDLASLVHSAIDSDQIIILQTEILEQSSNGKNTAIELQRIRNQAMGNAALMERIRAVSRRGKKTTGSELMGASQSRRQ